jgi:hypothetical protein
MWKDGIYDTLTGDTTLNALVPKTNIWYEDSPPDPSIAGKKQMPNVSFWSPGGMQPQFNAPAIAGSQYIDQIQFQVDVFSEDPALTDAISKRIDKLLNLQIIALDTGICMRIMRTSPLEVLQQEKDPSEKNLDVWHTPLLYEYMSQRTL